MSRAYGSESDPQWSWVLLLLFGLVCLIYGAVDGVEEMRYKQSAQVTTARLSGSWVRVGKRSSTTVNDYEFTVDGKTYGVSTGGSGSDQIEVEYLPSNPEHNRDPGRSYLPQSLVGLGLGVVFLIIGIFSFKSNNDLLND